MAHAHDTPSPPAFEPNEPPSSESTRLLKAKRADEIDEAVFESSKVMMRSPRDTNRVPAGVTGHTSASKSDKAVAGAERRRAPRAALEVPVSVRIGVEVLDGTSEDVSLTGIFVRVPRLIPSGRLVQLRFDLPQCLIEVEAVIVRFRTPAKGASGGVGLCFSNLTSEQEEEIAAYCHALGGIGD